MKKIFILLVCLAGLGYGQTTVPYLPEIPKIDGLLDNGTNRNSMGGYGVYRTYYEHPELYAAIAVLSGHPNLAQKWGGENELNFLDAENLKKFRSVPIFIFHGRNDLNCPFNLTENLVKTLQSKNLDVTFVIGEEGHSSMSESDRGKYHEWLKQQVK